MVNGFGYTFGGMKMSRTVQLWAVFSLALGLSFISWIHKPPQTTSDGWIYVMWRGPFTLLLFVTLWRYGTTAISRDRPITPALPRHRSFDLLLGLRAFACLLVLFGHHFFVVVPFTNGPFGVRQLLRSCPWAGVWVFFSLSGYLMGKGFISGRYPLTPDGLGLFFRNRALRILPVYFVAIIIMCAWFYPSIFQIRNVWILVEMALFDYRGDLPINPIGALWSVSTEVQFYLLAPFLSVGLMWLFRKGGALFFWCMIGIAAAGLAGRLALTHHFGLAAYSFSYTPMIPNLDIFLIGMSLNFLEVPLPIAERVGRHFGLYAVALTGGFYVALCAATGLFPHGLTLNEFVALCPTACILFCCAFIALSRLGKRIEVSGLWAWPLMAIEWIGVLSYCLYVLHPELMIYNSLSLRLPVTLTASVIRFAVVIPELFAVAIAFYFLVERPFELRKRGTAPKAS